MNNELNNNMEEAAVQTAEEVTAEPNQQEEYNQLLEALAEVKLKLALLLGGVAKEKLNEAAKLCEGFVSMGLTPEEAAEKAVQEYPHLKLNARELPKFAAQSGGSGDGFAAIRSIFAKR